MLKSRKKRIGQSVNAKGRSIQSKKHVRLHQWLMETPAWRSLDPYASRLLIELYSLYNGSNNGEVFLSVREAGRRCNFDPGTASNRFRLLEERGFIRRRSTEPYKWNERMAYRWILNEFDFAGQPATKEFMKWKPS